MPSVPSGPINIQGPVSPDSRQDVHEKPDLTRTHKHRKVEETAPEKRILVKPRTSPRKKLSEFNSVKPVTPETPEKLQVSTQGSELKTESVTPEASLPPADQQDSSRQQAMRLVKKTKAWQNLEKQLTKSNGQISKKRLGKLMVQMPKMDFSSSRTVSLMSLFALEQFNTGKFTQEQMGGFMDTFMSCYVKARADDQVQHAVKMLPSTPKKGQKPLSPGKAAILAEIAAMTKEKSGNWGAIQTARSALKTDMRADMYDSENQFLTGLYEQLKGRIGEIDEQVAQGMRQEMRKVLRAEGSGRKRKLAPKQQQKLIDDVDLMVRQFVESQLREKKQGIDNWLGAGESIDPIIDQILAKAEARRAGLIVELTKAAGPGLQQAFAQHQVPDTHDPDTLVRVWLEDNEKAKELAQAQELAALQAKSDVSVDTFDEWVDEMLRLVPEDQKHKVNDEFKEQLRQELEPVARSLLFDELVPGPMERSPFSRNDPLRKAMRKERPDSFKPVRKTVTESLEASIKELAKRAARRAETELQKSRPRSEPEKTESSPQVSEDKKVPPPVAPKPVKAKQATETVQSQRHRVLEGDALVPTLVRQFEQIIKNEKARADAHDRPAPIKVPGSKG